MNILVSGGSGYIGAYIVQKLLQQNHAVDIIARGENEFIKHFKNKVSVYYIDITEPFTITPDKNYDVFIHLAAANDIDSANPEYALNASVLGTKYALEFCKKNNIKKVIYYSTFQVYGYVDGSMTEDSTLLPTNDYGITHQFAEQYFQMYQRTSSIEYLIIRPTNIYGAPMFLSTDRWSLVPSCFCKEALEKGEINLLSSGLQTRDFVCVEDVAAVTAQYVEQFEMYKNQIVNVSSGYQFSILEIAHMVKEEYVKMFKTDCKLKVHSPLPDKKNNFALNRDKVLATKFKFQPREHMKSEINNIFNLLQTK